jgi:hypothetical protein
MRNTLIATVLSSWILLANFANAQTNNSYPMIMSVRPTAAQIGQSTDVEVSARYNLAGASQVIVAGSGVTGEVLPDEKENQKTERATMSWHPNARSDSRLPAT